MTAFVLEFKNNKASCIVNVSAELLKNSAVYCVHGLILVILQTEELSEYYKFAVIYVMIKQGEIYCSVAIAVELRCSIKRIKYLLANVCRKGCANTIAVAYENWQHPFK